MSASTERNPYDRDWLLGALRGRARTTDSQPKEQPVSFSFSARGHNREAIKQQIAEKMAGVVSSQPSHARDEAAVSAVAGQYVDLCAEPGPEEDLLASVHGSVSWTDSGGVRHVSVGVTVSLTSKQVP